MAAMTDLVRRLDVAGRRIGVVSAPGDRRDEDIKGIALAAVAAFDHVIFRRDEEQRGRGEREVPMMMAQACRDAGIPSDRVDVIVDEQASIDAALKMARPGDLLVVFADNITRSWKQIIYFKEHEPANDVGEHAPATDPPPPPPRRATETPIEGVGIIADERGVRLARETDD
jgi:cyanophycin synthetase